MYTCRVGGKNRSVGGWRRRRMREINRLLKPAIKEFDWISTSSLFSLCVTWCGERGGRRIGKESERSRSTSESMRQQRKTLPTRRKKKKWPGYFHEGTNRMDGWIVDGGRTRVVTVTARWRAFWQATLDVAAHAPLVLVVVLDDDERRSCWPESRALYRAPESVWAELAELMDATSMMSKPNPRTKEDPASIWQPRFLIMEQTPTMVHRFG